MYLSILWALVKSSCNVVTLMMQKLSSISLMGCKEIFRPGYVPRSLQTYSQPCKWPKKLDLLLPLPAKYDKRGSKRAVAVPVAIR